MKRVLGFLLLVTLMSLLTLGGSTAEMRAASVADGTAGRIVAMGDVHGDLRRLELMLNRAGLIDERGHWTGGASTFVLNGDFTDRGPAVRSVMDLLIEVQESARKAGGEVVILLGNHEMMNLIGDFRYVTEEIFSTFVDEKSEERREKAYRARLKLLQRNENHYGEPAPTDLDAFRKQWLDEHPMGFFEYVDAFGPRGSYGKWLRKLPALARVGEVLFVHGGIHPGFLDLDLKKINDKVRKEREAFDSYKRQMVSQGIVDEYATLGELLAATRMFLRVAKQRNTFSASDLGRESRVRAARSLLGIGEWMSINKDGPLWFRGYASWSEEEGSPLIDSVMERYGLRAIVVGHTIASEDEITSRFDGRVFLIDTLSPSALILEGDQYLALYPGTGGEVPKRAGSVTLDTVNAGQ